MSKSKTSLVYNTMLGGEHLNKNLYETEISQQKSLESQDQETLTSRHVAI